MYYKLGRMSFKIMRKATKYSDAYLEGDVIDVDNFVVIIEDLLFEVERLEEKIKDIEQDRDDNYKKISQSEMYE